MAKNIPEWFEWLKEQSAPVPSTANQLAELHRQKQIPEITRNTARVLDVLLNEFDRIKRSWSVGDEFRFYMETENDLAVDRARRERLATGITVAQHAELAPFKRRLVTYLSSYIDKLEIPLERNESVTAGLSRIFGSPELGNEALSIIRHAVETRLAAEEMLHLLGSETVLELPSMRSYANHHMTFGFADSNEDSSQD